MKFKSILLMSVIFYSYSLVSSEQLFNALNIADFLPKNSVGKKITKKTRATFTEANPAIFSVVGGGIEGAFSTNDVAFTESFTTSKVTNLLTVPELQSLSSVVIALTTANKEAYYIVNFDEKVLAKIPGSVLSSGLYLQFDFDASKKQIGVMLTDKNNVIYAVSLLTNVLYQITMYSIAINQVTFTNSSIQGKSFGKTFIPLNSTTGQSVLMTVQAGNENIQKKKKTTIQPVSINTQNNPSLFGGGYAQGSGIGFINAIKGATYNNQTTTLPSLSEIKVSLFNQTDTSSGVKFTFGYNHLQSIAAKGSLLTSGAYIAANITSSKDNKEIISVAITDQAGNIYGVGSFGPVTPGNYAFDTANVEFILGDNSIQAIQNIPLKSAQRVAFKLTGKLQDHQTSSGSSLQVSGSSIKDIGMNIVAIPKQVYAKISLAALLPNFSEMITPNDLENGIYIRVQHETQGATIDQGTYVQGQRIAYIGVYSSSGELLAYVAQYLTNSQNGSPLTDSIVSTDIVCQTDQKVYTLKQVPIADAVFITTSTKVAQKLTLKPPVLNTANATQLNVQPIQGTPQFTQGTSFGMNITAKPGVEYAQVNILAEAPFLQNLIYYGDLVGGLYAAVSSKPNAQANKLAAQGQQIATITLFDANSNPYVVFRKVLVDSATNQAISDTIVSYDVACFITEAMNVVTVKSVPIGNLVRIGQEPPQPSNGGNGGGGPSPWGPM